ncbi:thiamine phosphate synthase [Phenylobacterium sp.]|uniref:thiamine phosphate synthase n=1 Tax=Phenylobacterium sp. TaxID=1871053 RepID=UPI0037C9F545
MPTLLAFTDPARSGDLNLLAASLPPGAALVYRAFAATDAEAVAQSLAAILHARGALLLIGQDTELARKVAADGVHLPQRSAHRAGAIRRANPRWIVTSAAHDVRAARSRGGHAVVISAVFPSQSPSAAAPLGPVRLATLVRLAGQPAYALGGVNRRNAARLRMTGVIGVAAIDGLRT